MRPIDSQISFAITPFVCPTTLDVFIIGTRHPESINEIVSAEQSVEHQSIEVPGSEFRPGDRVISFARSDTSGIIGTIKSIWEDTITVEYTFNFMEYRDYPSAELRLAKPFPIGIHVRCKDGSLGTVTAHDYGSYEVVCEGREFNIQADRLRCEPLQGYGYDWPKIIKKNPSMSVAELEWWFQKANSCLELVRLNLEAQAAVEQNKLSLPNAIQLARLPRDQQSTFINRALAYDTPQFKAIIDSQIKVNHERALNPVEWHNALCDVMNMPVFKTPVGTEYELGANAVFKFHKSNLAFTFCTVTEAFIKPPSMQAEYRRLQDAGMWPSIAHFGEYLQFINEAKKPFTPYFNRVEGDYWLVYNVHAAESYSVEIGRPQFHIYRRTWTVVDSRINYSFEVGDMLRYTDDNPRGRQWEDRPDEQMCSFMRQMNNSGPIMARFNQHILDSLPKGSIVNQVHDEYIVQLPTGPCNVQIDSPADGKGGHLVTMDMTVKVSDPDGLIPQSIHSKSEYHRLAAQCGLPIGCSPIELAAGLGRDIQLNTGVWPDIPELLSQIEQTMEFLADAEQKFVDTVNQLTIGELCELDTRATPTVRTVFCRLMGVPILEYAQFKQSTESDIVCSGTAPKIDPEIDWPNDGLFDHQREILNKAKSSSKVVWPWADTGKTFDYIPAFQAIDRSQRVPSGVEIIDEIAVVDQTVLDKLTAKREAHNTRLTERRLTLWLPEERDFNAIVRGFADRLGKQPIYWYQMKFAIFQVPTEYYQYTSINGVACYTLGGLMIMYLHDNVDKDINVDLLEGLGYQKIIQLEKLIAVHKNNGQETKIPGNHMVAGDYVITSPMFKQPALLGGPRHPGFSMASRQFGFSVDSLCRHYGFSVICRTDHWCLFKMNTHKSPVMVGQFLVYKQGDLALIHNDKVKPDPRDIILPPTLPDFTQLFVVPNILHVYKTNGQCRAIDNAREVDDMVLISKSFPQTIYSGIAFV